MALQLGEIIAGPGARRDAHIPLGMLQVGPFVNHVLTYDEDERVRAAKKYAMESSIKHVLMKQQMSLQQSKQEHVIRHQTLLLMCRVYVGSISFELNEEAVRVAFSPFGAIRTINMSYDPVLQKHKGFAFIEYEVPEGASVALEQMQTATMGGRSIKVGRPSNMPQSAPIIEELTQNSLTSPRIYVASIHPDVTEDDLRSVFSAFGNILKCELIMYPNTPRHKGYGYITFDSSQAAHDAIQAMNLFDLAGMYLRIGRAILPEGVTCVSQLAQAATPLPTASAVAAAAVTAKLQGSDGKIVDNPPHLYSTGFSLTTSPANIAAGATSDRSVSSSRGGFGSDSAKRMDSPAMMSQPPTSSGSNADTNFSSPKAELDKSSTSPTPYVPPPTLVLPKLASRPTPSAMYMAPAADPDVLLGDDKTSSQFDASATTDDAHAIKTTSDAEEAKIEPLATAAAAAGVDDDDDFESKDLNIRSREARRIMTQKLAGRSRLNEARVICLRGMVTADEVDETLEEEVKEECSKFGPVQKVAVVVADDDAAVKIFVEFAAAAGAQSAQSALNGRFFGGRQVACNVYDQALYDFNDLTG